MPHVPEVLKCLFSSTLRIKLLSHYFAHPREYFYVRQLAGALDYSAGNVARELANLERNGLLISRTTGNRKHYAVAQSSPFVHDLRSIFMKANSAHGILGDRLARRNRWSRSPAMNRSFSGQSPKGCPLPKT